jgi:amino acid adenylation domain-containing protein
MSKTPGCVAAMLGAAYANCPYVPIDTDMPPDRLNKIIDKLNPAACITDEKRQYLLDGGAVEDDILIYDEIASGFADDALLADVHRRRISGDILYVLFTSGSTGVPKGVTVSHENMIDYTVQLSEKFGFNEETVFGQIAPFFFDLSVFYVYQTLLNGCTDRILSKTTTMFAARTVDFLNAHKVNTIDWVPTSYNIVAKSGVFDKRKPEYLEKCFFVGEVMPAGVLNVWRRALPNAQFVNIFGPAEITDTFLYYIADREFGDDEPLPIGGRYDNCDTFLLNEDGTETAIGEVGEMCVRGVKVSLGYWNDPELTAKNFVQNPLNPYYRETIYKTGDLAYVNERGELMFAGRRDFQIKHAGHRIELGEIEVAANSVDGVELCACVFDTDKNIIVLFYVGPAEDKSVREALKGKLQDYMVPDRILRIGAMPRTGGGKISRQDLKARLR